MPYQVAVRVTKDVRRRLEWPDGRCVVAGLSEGWEARIPQESIEAVSIEETRHLLNR
jgi:hypothetical protein